MAQGTIIKAGWGTVLAVFTIAAVLTNSALKNNSSTSQRSSAERTNHFNGLISTFQADYNDSECRDVHDVVDQCDFVTRAEDCGQEGFFDYFDFIYCVVGGDLVPLAMVILVLWWLFLFIGLAVCADDFFCPSLVVISKTLSLSPNVAGVTFLAFGNGAPDFFSAISALSGVDSNPELGLGGLFGAGIFVTAMVVGAIALVKPFKATERPFLRDVCFYLTALFWAFLMLWREKVYLAEAVGFVCLYFVYVIVVVVSGAVYKRQKESSESKGDKNVVLKQISTIEEDEEKKVNGTAKAYNMSLSMDFSIASGNSNMGFEPDGANGIPYDRTLSNQTNTTRVTRLSSLTEDVEVNVRMTDDEIFSRQLSYINNSVQPEKPGLDDDDDNIEGEVVLIPLWQQFLTAINPINMEEWPDMRWYSRIYEVFKSPIVFLITMTNPVVNYEIEDTHNWNRALNTWHVLIGPTVVSLLTGLAFIEIGGVFPLYGLTMIVGVVFGALIFFTSSNYEKPKYHWVFGYLGFAIAMTWIYTLANEIVGLLEGFGVVFNISEAILGLTLLAWGNSIGDLISNTVMARQGFPRMGFAACFGAPFFNLTLGFGLSMLIKMINAGGSSVQLGFSAILLILSSFLFASLVSSLVAIPLMKFKLGRPYGVYLACLYLAFIVIALLTETKVILANYVH